MYFPFSFSDKDGFVCISILHEAGDDKYGYESASERWLPVHTVETIMLSVISMLCEWAVRREICLDIFCIIWMRA